MTREAEQKVAEEAAGLAIKMSPDEQAAILHVLRKKRLPLEQGLCDNAIDYLVKRATHWYTSLEGVRTGLFFGLAASADARVRSASDAQTLLQTSRVVVGKDAFANRALKESAYALALACRVPVDLSLQRYDDQIKRQDCMKLIGKALNIIAGTFPWTGGAGTAAESGLAIAAEAIFSTAALDLNAVKIAVDDLCKIVSGLFEQDIPDGREPDAASYSGAFTSHFYAAWNTLSSRSNQLRIFDGANVELGFAV